MEASDRIPHPLLAGVDVFNSKSVAPKQRLDWWREAVSSNNGLDVICGTKNFLGRMTRRSLGTCCLYEVKVETPYRVVRQMASPDLCYVNIQRGETPVHFRGAREFSLSAGAMAIYPSVKGFEIEFAGGIDSLILAVPTSVLDRQVDDLDRHFEQPLVYDRTLTALLAQTCQKILELGPSASHAVNDSIATAVLSLVCAVLRQSDDGEAKAVTWSQRATLQRAKAYITAHLNDPDLSPAGVADSLGIAVNYLHKLFRSNNSTVMQFALAERLERCRAELAKTSMTGNISQIAFAWGFNDASHFTHSFRSRFGMSPRQYRQGLSARVGTARETSGRPG